MFPFGEPSDSKAAIFKIPNKQNVLNKLPGINCFEEIGTGIRFLQISLKPCLSSQWSLVQGFVRY